MSDRRDEMEELGELAALPPDDPRVRGLDARTRARLRAYREFLAPGGELPGERRAEAEEQLWRLIEREVIGSPGAAREDASPARGPGGTGGGLLRALLGPTLRPAFAAAAVVFLAGGAWWLSTRRAGEPPAMRGPTAVAPEAGPRTIRLAGGALRFEWPPVPEAERYVVVFLSPELAELARIEGTAEPHLELRAGALPAGLPAGGAALWRAVGMRGADEVGRTRTSPVTLP